MSARHLETIAGRTLAFALFRIAVILLFRCDLDRGDTVEV